VKRVCVFLGSREGFRPAYAAAARVLGERIAARGHGLVYGGASVGLMGALADACLLGGGSVIGVIPHGVFDKEVAHTRLTELHVVRSMHERKALMADRSDAFLALPGGLGTLDELFEALTWRQLGLHAKPVGLLDVGGYWAPLRSAVDRMVAEGFLDASPFTVVTESADEALDVLLGPPAAGA
jgi:uncharacterized protein (TIGR00730 family)